MGPRPAARRQKAAALGEGRVRISTLTIKTILIFIPCVMPSFCAFSGARSPFVVMPFVFLNLDKMRNLCKSTHVHRHAAVAAGVRGRSHPQAGASARADAPQVERNPVLEFQPPR